MTKQDSGLHYKDTPPEEASVPASNEPYANGQTPRPCREAPTPCPDLVRLATFIRPNGNKVMFLAENALDGDLGTVELGACGTRPAFRPNLDQSTLDRFLQIAPRDLPVPDVLAKRYRCGRHDDDMRGRNTVEIVRGDVFLTAETVEAGAASSTWHCGNNTEDAFEADFCFSSGGRDKVAHCDSEAWWFLRRTKENRQRIFSITTFCDYWDEPGLPFPDNTGQGEVTHLRWDGVIVKHWRATYGDRYSGEGILQHNWWWWVDWGGRKYNRRVEHNANGGHVRGYSVFYNE